MKKTVEFICTSCSLIGLERFKNSKLHGELKGERLDVRIGLEFDSSGDTTKLTSLLLQETIQAKVMNGLKDLIFKAPMKKEFTESDMFDFVIWYFQNNHLEETEALKIWKKRYNR